MARIWMLVANCCLACIMATAKADDPPGEEKTPKLNAHGDPLPPGAVGRLGTIRLRHGGHIDAVAISPDAKTIAAVSPDQITLWDAATGKAKHRLPGPGYGGWSLDFSPDGGTLATTSYWGIEFFDVKTGKSQGNHRPLKRPAVVRFSLDGKYLAVCGDDGGLLLWDVAAKKVGKQLNGHELRVDAVAWSPSKTELASCGEDMTLRIWDVAAGKQIHNFKLERRDQSLTYSQASFVAARHRHGDVTLIDTSTGRVVDASEATFAQKHASATSAISKDGKLWAYSVDNKIVIREVVGNKLLSPLDEESVPARAVAFSQDSSMLATEEPKQLRLWSVVEKSVLQTIKGREFGNAWANSHTVAFSSDKQAILALAAPYTLHHFDLRSGKLTTTQDLPLNSNLPYSIKLSPDGTKLVSCYDNYGSLKEIKLYEPAKGKVTREWKDIGGARVLAISPDGKVLGEAHRGPEQHQKWFVLRSLQTGEEIKNHKLDKKIASFIEFTSLAFSHNQKTLAAGSAFGLIHFFDADTGKETAKLQGHCGKVLSVAFSPNGRYLASSAEDTTVLIWDVAARMGPNK